MAKILTEATYRKPSHRDLAGTWLVDDCPFCHGSHSHIAADGRADPGERIAHCTREAAAPRTYVLTRKT